MLSKAERADRALLHAFLTWLRAQGLAICVRAREPEGTRVLWQPLSRGSAQRVADFAADLEREEARGQAQEAQEAQEESRGEG